MLKIFKPVLKFEVENGMKHCLWLTDLHVDRLSKQDYRHLLHRIHNAAADAIWITGDIGNPPYNWHFLETLLTYINTTVYFVLGNHDFYGLKIEEARSRAVELMKRYANAYYLTTMPSVICNDVVLAGVDGWANTGKIPLLEKTWDGDEIQDWQGKTLSLLQDSMNREAKKDAEQLLIKCRQGMMNNILKKIVLLTHVPPGQACLGSGSPKSFQAKRTVYYSQALAEALNELKTCYPDVLFNLFSGHLHCQYHYRIGHQIHGFIMDAYHPDKPLTWISL
ncbi:metallophosphoesterase family protein [Legionella oakridgensis]|uniref:metallophosphoesterase family protein n=1 Tax=Legionella oakridgensis TaxID=29423 RepID=UPI00130DA985|nr:metallophosphoesterase [Legionella oakridgensis]